MIFSLPGMIVGLGTGMGLTIVLLSIPVFKQRKLDDRLAPYVRDSAIVDPNEGGDHVITPFPTLERILRPYLGRGARSLERMLGGGNAVRRRLRQAGLRITLEEFRIEQLIWGGLGFAVMFGLSLVLFVTGWNPIALLVLCLCAFIFGILLRDRQLTTQITNREKQMVEEFPTVADMLALSVSAGEGPMAALERVAKITKGELAKEFQVALSEAQTGDSLIEALSKIGDRTNLSVLARFVDGMSVAIERGTPLADVLRSQAAEVRESGRRNLIEAGGKKEIGMMVPIVFLILPVTVLFALYPGVIQIQAVSQ